MESWKSINGYNDYYISDCGRIKSEKNGKTKILKQSKDSKGQYMLVCLCKEGEPKHFLVHRLVASAFLKNEKNYEQVNHKNCNKKDNRLENLEWCSRSQNQKHAYKNGLIRIPTYKGKFGKEHNKSVASVLISPDGKEKTFYSFAEFKRETGGDNTSLCWARTHKKLPYKFHRGFLRGWTLIKTFNPHIELED